MKRIVPIILCLSVIAAATPRAAAKDMPIQRSQCPAPVQAAIEHYSTQGTFESVSLDEKKKSGGPAVYEVKFSMRDGKRVEVHLSSEGKVMLFEEKKPKS